MKKWPRIRNQRGGISIARASRGGSKDKGTCAVLKCEEPAIRSISAKKAGKILKLGTGPREKKAHLCKEHYKEFRKATKRDRKYEMLGRK
jgi:hypothetical protein